MNNIHIKFEDSKIFNVNGITIKFKGLVFYKDNNIGKESLKRFFADYHDSWKNNLELLHGNYILNIIDNDVNYLFTDNSGMARIYFYQDNIFEKYLELINYFHLGVNEIDYYGVVEYLQQGYSIFHTFFKNVRVLARDEIIILDNNIEILSKNIKSIFSKASDIEQFYRNFSRNFNKQNIACDLTAGIDSRMNVSLLKGANVKFKTCISGIKDHIDVIKCNEISRKLNLETLYYNIDDDIKKKVLDDIFFAVDGQFSILEYYKNYNLTKGLMKSKINIRLSGAGGELYKYSWIMCDFPFFNKKSFSLKKICNKWFFSKNNMAIYTESFQNNISNYQNNLINLLEQYREINNVKTYDRICYETIMRNSASTQMIQGNDNYVRYCPLLELSIVRNGVNSSIKDRILYMYHRRIINRNTPLITKIKTNLGLSVDSAFVSILMDGFALFKRYLLKIKNKSISRKVLSIDKANSKEIYQYVKLYDKELINLLINNNILCKEFDNTKIDNATYSRLITIAKMIEYINK